MRAGILSIPFLLFSMAMQARAAEPGGDIRELKLRDWESRLTRAKWTTERDSFDHITAYDVSEIRFARNGHVGVSVGVIFMRILGAGMLLPRR